jgi:hypothetical protein
MLILQKKANLFLNCSAPSHRDIQQPVSLAENRFAAVERMTNTNKALLSSKVTKGLCWAAPA